MKRTYESEQSNYWVAAVVFIVIPAMYWFVSRLNQGDAALALLITGGVGVLVAVLLSKLTLKIDPSGVSHYFFGGIWRKHYPLETIESADVEQFSWLYGYGIRLTTKGWLYRVSGREALALSLDSGRKVFIGSDDPASALKALTTQMETAK